jgi:hypothetical protein
MENKIIFEKGQTKSGTVISTSMPQDELSTVKGCLEIVSSETTTQGIVANVAWLNKKLDAIEIIKVLIH